MAKIDSLEISISAKAPKANTAIDELIKKLTSLDTSLSKLDTTSFDKLANGAKSVNKSTGSMLAGMQTVSRGAKQATKDTQTLARAFGKFYANYFLFIRSIKGIWGSIESAFDYTETFNYFAVTMDKIGKEFGNKFEQYGYESAEAYADSFSSRLNALTSKMTGYAVGDSGELISSGMPNLGLDPEQMMKFQAKVSAVTNSVGLMGETSINTAKALSMLSADLSSLTNTNLESVMTNLSSGIIGQSRALYKYGIDITNATLQTYAYAEGIEKSLTEMTQAEKMQLRLLAILDQSRVAWGDQANTLNSVANQYRVFEQQIGNFGRVIGNLFLPIVQKALPVINGMVISLSRLFTTLGFKLWGDSWLTELMDGISGTAVADIEDIDGALEDTADSASKLQSQLRGFDEINVINSSSQGKDNGLASTIDLTSAISKATSDYEKAWEEAFSKMENKSEGYADRISGFFEKIGKPLHTLSKNIDWKTLTSSFNSILNFAKKFVGNVGKGFVDFLNGLAKISAPTLNSIAKAVEVIFSTLGAISPAVLQTIGGALGGLVTSLLGLKAFSTISTTVSKGITIIMTALSNLNPVTAAVLAIGTVTGAILQLKETNDEVYSELVNNSVFDGLGVGIDTVSEKMGMLFETTGISAENMANFQNHITATRDTLNESLTAIDEYKNKFRETGTITESEAIGISESVGKITSALKNDLEFNSNVVFDAFQRMTTETAEKLGVDLNTMTTLLNNFKSSFGNTYDNMQNEVDSLIGKVANGTATQADTERLEKVLGDLSYLSEESIAKSLELQEMAQTYMDMDFQSVEEATNAINTVSEKARENLNNLETFYGDYEKTLKIYKEQVKRSFESGWITEEEMTGNLAILNKLTDVMAASFEEDKAEIQGMFTTFSEYVIGQLDKAGVEVYREAENKELSILDILFGKHPTIDAINVFNDEIMTPIVDEIKTASEKVGLEFNSAGSEMWQQFVLGVETEAYNTNGIYNAAKAQVQATALSIEENTSIATDAFLKMAGLTVEGFEEGINKAVSSHEFTNTMKNVGTSAENATKDALGIHSPSRVFYDIGVFTMQGFANGIDSMSGAIMQKVAEIANNVANTLKSALQIHSPSKVFEKLGSYTMEGYQLGLESMYSPVERSMLNFANKVVSLPETVDYQYSTNNTDFKKYNDYADTSNSNAETNALLRRQNELLLGILQKEATISAESVFTSVRKSNDEFYRRTGESAFA